MASRARSQPYQRPRRSDFSSASEPSPEVPVRVNRLIISNLHYEISEADLVKIFQPYGSFTRNPSIRYDRSGRSTGFAYVNYENEDDANHAKRELDGVLAKGEPISITVESFIPRNANKKGDRGGGRSSSSHTIPLKDRVAKTPLIHRFGGEITTANSDDMAIDDQHQPGPLRHARGGARGGGRGARGGRPPRDSKPKTADDLDKELEAYVDKGKDSKDAKVSGEDVVMTA